MEIDITSIFEADTWSLSGSRATHGPDAGPRTWEASKDYGERHPLLTEPKHFEAFRDHMRGFGAWDEKEIDNWSENDCNALFAQLIAGDKREAGIDCLELDDEDGWNEYEKGAEKGRYCGNLYRGDDKRVYYCLGN